MPLSASSKRPTLSSVAPVNDPFLWPNSSLSTSDSDSAEMFTVTKGLSDRRPVRWIIRAMSSFPVPLSPVMRTVVSLAAERAAVCSTLMIALLLNTTSVLPKDLLDLLADGPLLAVQGERLVRAHEDVRDLRLARWLDEVIVGARFQDLHGLARILEGGHDHHAHERVDPLHLAKDIQPVHVGQAVVGHHEIDLRPGEDGQAVPAACRGPAGHRGVVQ